MSTVRNQLDEGINITCIDSDRNKTTTVCVCFTVPLTAFNATATALLSEVLIQGTAVHTTFKDFSRACDDNYSCTVNVGTIKKGEAVCLVFSATCLENKYALNGEDISGKAFALLRELILTPYLPDGVFSSEYVDRERQSLRQQILSMLDNKPSYASYKAQQIMCTGEAFAVPGYGDISVLADITPQQLTDFREYIINKAPVEIVCVGRNVTDYMEADIRSSLPLSPRTAVMPKTETIKLAGEPRFVTEKADASQSTLVLGFRLGGEPSGKDRAAYSMFFDILSGSPVSKLFMNVREKLSLCYYCSAGGDKTKCIMFVKAGIDAVNKDSAVSEILHQLKDMADGKINDSEFSAAKLHMSGICKSFLDSQWDLCNYYISGAVSGYIMSPEEIAERLAIVTLNDVSAVASLVSLDTVFLLEGVGTDSEESEDETTIENY